MTPSSPFLVGLGGTLRERSRSRVALQEALAYAETKNARTALLDLRILNLPMYIPDLPLEAYPAEHRGNLQQLITSVRQADALIWASPSYHGTVAGVFKNALDFLELLSDDPHPYLTGKAVGLISINDSLPFEAMANSVYELRAWLAPSRLTLNGDDFDPAFTLKAGRPQRRLHRIVDDLLTGVKIGGS